MNYAVELISRFSRTCLEWLFVIVLFVTVFFFVMLALFLASIGRIIHYIGFLPSFIGAKILDFLKIGITKLSGWYK